jgi:hypothetical protein
MTQDTTDARLHTLEQSIKRLEQVNKKIAEYVTEQELLTEEIIAAIGHDHSGERSYEVDKWTVKCRTPMTYSLDTKAYKKGDVFLDAQFNPIQESITYKVDKKLYDTYIVTAPESARLALVKLITLKPAKQSVTIGYKKVGGK